MLLVWRFLWLQCLFIWVSMIKISSQGILQPLSTTILWKSEPQHDDSGAGTFYCWTEARLAEDNTQNNPNVYFAKLDTHHNLIVAHSFVSVRAVCFVSFKKKIHCSSWVDLLRVAVLMQLCSSDTVGVRICPQCCWEALRHLKQTHRTGQKYCKDALLCSHRQLQHTIVWTQPIS